MFINFYITPKPMKGKCVRCNREDRYYSIKNKLCMVCYQSLELMKRTRNGTIPEKIMANRRRDSKKYYENNKEKFKIYYKEYYKKNKETRKKHNSRSYVKYIRQVIIKERGGKCEICGRNNQLEIHHKIYATTLKELKKVCEVYCRSCHRKLHRLSNQPKDI